MSNDEVIEPIQLESRGPGNRLRAARQRHRMEVADVAGRLHLRHYIIDAVEANDYAALSSPVFVRGYLKSYARLVGEPEEEILREYDQSYGSKKVSNVRVVLSPAREVDTSHSTIRFINLGAILVSLVLAGIWGVERFSGEPLVPLLRNMAQKSETTTPAAKPEPAEDVVVLTPPSEPTPRVVTTSTASQGIQDLVNSIESPSQLIPAADVKETTLADSDAPQEKGVVLELLGDSWLEVKDASGEFRLSGTLKKGEKHLLRGKPPYKMIFGSGEKVRLLVDGQPFDHSRYIKGSVARFTYPTQR